MAIHEEKWLGQKNILCGFFSPQANYTDRATAACQRGECQFLGIESVAWSVQRISMAINLGFLDRRLGQKCFIIDLGQGKITWPSTKL
jgi:hypothetical protein